MHYIHHTHSFMQRKEYLLLWESKPYPDFPSGPTEQNGSYANSLATRYPGKPSIRHFQLLAWGLASARKKRMKAMNGCWVGNQQCAPSCEHMCTKTFCYIFTALNYNSLNNSLNQFIFCLTKYLYLGRKFYMPAINSKLLLGTFSSLY